MHCGKLEGLHVLVRSIRVIAIGLNEEREGRDGREGGQEKEMRRTSIE